MKGIIGGLLLGMSLGLIFTNKEDWWIKFGSILLLLGGVELLISDRIETAIDKLKND